MALLSSFQAIEEIPSVQGKQLDGMKKGIQYINQSDILPPIINFLFFNSITLFVIHANFGGRRFQRNRRRIQFCIRMILEKRTRNSRRNIAVQNLSQSAGIPITRHTHPDFLSFKYLTHTYSNTIFGDSAQVTAAVHKRIDCLCFTANP